ncbi:TPA: hypothetical protein ACMDNO_002650 [Vibrio cholerae]
MNFITPLKPKDIWLNSGLINDVQWSNKIKELMLENKFPEISSLLGSDSLIFIISSKDIIVFQSYIENSIIERVVNSYKICKKLALQITDTLSKYRILIVSKSNSIDQHCTLLSNGTSIAVVNEDKLLNTNDIYHEVTHLFALSGYLVIDEGLATFIEDIAPIFSDLEDVAVAEEWLKHKVRSRTNKSNPYVYGAASICAALLTGGVKNAKNLIRLCQRSNSEYQCYNLMEESLKKSDDLIYSKDACPESINLTDDYFSGRHASFKSKIRCIIIEDPINYTYDEWLNIARCSVLLASEPYFDKEFSDNVNNVSKKIPIDLVNIRWLFNVSSQIKSVYSCTSQDLLINSSKSLITNLSVKIDDDNLGKDAMIILMYLYYYLPKFAGGSIENAISLSRIMNLKHGIIVPEFKYIKNDSE